MLVKLLEFKEQPSNLMTMIFKLKQEICSRMNIKKIILIKNFPISLFCNPHAFPSGPDWNFSPLVRERSTRAYKMRLDGMVQGDCEH